ncbi:MAG: BACON domain-containing protein, partial [Bacteroidales bacterium]|nr:BACON domain-containing protein [Bacteroidales bacterium]
MKHDSYLKYLFILFISLSMISGCRENQPGAELSLASPVINIPQSGGYVDFNIFTNTSWHIDNPEGFSLSPLSGKGSTTVRLTTEPNNQVASVRSGVFTVVGEENLSVVVTVTQPGIAPVLTVSPQQIEASWSQEV